VTHMTALARANGSRGLLTLALDSAIEIERLRDGDPFDAGTWLRFADALVSASEPAASAPTQKFFHSGYFEPFRRLSGADAKQPAAEEIQNIIRSFANDLRCLADKRAASAESLERLLDNCLTLHSALLRESSAKDARRHPKRDSAPAGFRAA
jgi:hypothetical protein